MHLDVYMMMQTVPQQDLCTEDIYMNAVLSCGTILYEQLF